MKVKTNYDANFVWTEMRVEIDRETRKYRASPLDGIYSIKLDDTTGTVKKYFKNDLIKGSDRFLVAIWDVGENYYNFELIMKTEIPEEVFEYISPLSEFIINQNVTEPTVMTIR